MTDTLRELYIQGIMTAFRDGGVPADVSRSLGEAYSREEGDVVIVHRGGEDPDNGMYGVTDRKCDIRISVLTRNDAPDQRADQIMAVAHPLVMNFTGQGLIQILEGPTDPPKFATNDGKACLITTHYEFHYRTQPDSLTA